MDNKNRNADENESNAAKRIKALGEDIYENHDLSPIKVNKWANFWYHHKVKVIMITAFSFMIIVAMWQFLSKQNPDAIVLYSGPVYITANENSAFCDAVESIMPDYNGDDKKMVQLNDIVFLSDGQIKKLEAEAEASGGKFMCDITGNAQMKERFSAEVFGGEASICILSVDQYMSVKSEDGFVKLSDLFDETPSGAYDECAVIYKETEFCRFFNSADIFADDAVIALRKISTASALTGRKKAERLHGYSKDLFCRIVEWESSSVEN